MSCTTKSVTKIDSPDIDPKLTRSKLPVSKRALSSCSSRDINPSPPLKGDRSCQNLTPFYQLLKKSPEHLFTSGPDGIDRRTFQYLVENDGKEMAMPQCVITKILRVVATKKREFMKLRKSLITQQNALLETYALLKELAARSEATSALEESLGEIRLLSVNGWAPHDLLLLLRDDFKVPLSDEISGIFGPQVLQQISNKLNSIPKEVLSVCSEIMEQRLELLNQSKNKRPDRRSTYLSNIEWKQKHLELDAATENLHRMVNNTIEKIKANITQVLELAKIPWVDREAMVKKLDRLYNDNMVLQHKLEEFVKKEDKINEGKPPQVCDQDLDYQTLSEELTKERAAREALKGMFSTAEGMLFKARSRIATLERQIKETRTELEDVKKKHKDLEQLNRQRMSRKFYEVSRPGEDTVESLRRQRDALQLRVNELREQTEFLEREAQVLQTENRLRVESLQRKIAEQEKSGATAQKRVQELELKEQKLEARLQAFKERSAKLMDVERKRCLDYVPSKESEPSDRETEIWKELQATRVALARMEEKLRKSRADKDDFLNSLSQISQEKDPENMQNQITMKLIDKEQLIDKLQRTVEELKENDKQMEQSMTQYENQLASLRLEVTRLRNYDVNIKELPNQELQTELLELQMQVDSLTRERSSLMKTATSRALMLERHERSAELFALMIRTRRELGTLLDRRSIPTQLEDAKHAQTMSRSLASVCESEAATWTALRGERARVLRLESALAAQSLQLEREGQLRTKLEQRSNMLERQILQGAYGHKNWLRVPKLF